MALPADRELTTEQQRVFADTDRPLRVVGPAGSGKTTALIARFRHLVARVPASSVLVLCHTRDGAGRLLDAVLPDLAGGFDTLPVSTFHGLAFDLVRRHHGELELITGAEQRRLVTGLLASEGPAQWRTLHHLLGRQAFVQAVAGALVDLQASLVGNDEVRARAEAAGVEARWDALLAFRQRYRAALDKAGVIDAAGLLATAAALLRQPEVAAAEHGRFGHVLVDDYEAPDPATDRLLSGLAGLGAVVAVTGNPDAAAVARVLVGDDAGGTGFLGPFMAAGDAIDVRLTRSFRHPTPPELVHCSHPAVEPEAVAGALLAAHDDGVEWHDMAVLVRRPGERARAIAQALARHHIPVAPMAGPLAAEPTVAGVVDMLRWTAGEDAALDRLLTSPVAGLDPAEVRTVRREAAAVGTALEDHPRLQPLADLRRELQARTGTDTPAALVFEVWRRRLAGADIAEGSGQDDRALDALVSFCDALARRAERNPHERLEGFLAAIADDDAGFDTEPWRSTAGLSAQVVTVTSAERAVGREWHTVVVAGCVEGEWPRIHAPIRLFDRELLEPGPVPGAPERRRRSLVHERRLFAAAQATATARVVASAAPEPGVLLSRFVEGWPGGERDLPLAPGPDPSAIAVTTNPAPAAASGSLRLSASQLATYDDCPLRYSYRYVLGARDEVGVHAGLGSLVHEVLALFLDPETPSGFPHNREGLMALAEERWRDDIARYRPQVEEARRDYFAMLAAWWEAEGSQAGLAPDVLAVERPFEVDVGPHRMRGVIDRVDRADGGAGIRIVDYKTGKAEPTAEKVADDIQLAIYHLAASREPALAALGRATQLRLLYLRSMHCFEQEVGVDHERSTEQRVMERAGEILAEHFDPSVEANCRTCSFQRLCPLHDEGRQLA